jgi:hypothetical protein
MISYAFVFKEVPINMGLILKDYRAVGDVNKFRAYLCTSTHAIHNQGARSTATKVGFSKNLL